VWGTRALPQSPLLGASLTGAGRQTGKQVKSAPPYRTVLTHLRRMVLKINFRRFVKNKSPEEEIKAYNWHFNSHKELPRPPKRRAYGLFLRLHRANRTILTHLRRIVFNTVLSLFFFFVSSLIACDLTRSWQYTHIARFLTTTDPPQVTVKLWLPQPPSSP